MTQKMGKQMLDAPRMPGGYRTLLPCYHLAQVQQQALATKNALQMLLTLFST